MLSQRNYMKQFFIIPVAFTLTQEKGIGSDLKFIFVNKTDF